MKRFLLMAASVAALGLAMTATGVAQEAAPGFDRGRNQSVAERPRPEYDPAGVQVRAWFLRPEMVSEVGYSDNVFAEENSEDSDVYLSLRPRLEGETTWSRHGARFAVGAERTFFNDTPKNDEFSPYAEGELRLDIGRDGAISLGGRTANDSEGRTSPDQPAAALSPVEYDINEVVLGARYTFNRVRVSARALSRDLDYEDALSAAGVVLDQDDRDRTEREISVRGEYAMSPSFAIVAEAGANNREYDLNPPAVAVNRESNGRSYTVGANFDVARLARGEVTVGYLEQEYKDASIGDINGLALNARLDWFPTDRTTIGFTASRTVAETGLTFAAGAEQTAIGVRVDHELRRNVILSGALSGGARDYQGIDREDDLRRGELSVRYLVNRRVELRAGYALESQSSEGAARDRDFDVGTGFVALALRL
jgi:hypothetical protein